MTNDLLAVAYASTATYPLSSRDLDALLIDARTFNGKVHVTGALLHHKGMFFQYFEGTPAAVAGVYERIKQSSQHKNILEVLNQPVSERQFKQWHMAFSEAPGTVLQILTNEYWEMTLPALEEQQAKSPGLRRLLNFWSTAIGNDVTV